MKVFKILVINPGSTSTKVALYFNKQERFVKSIEHSLAELSKYKNIMEQYEMRKNACISALTEAGYTLGELSAVVGRGGILPPVRSGAYEVNKKMLDRLMNRPVAEHASNLGAVIAYEIANRLGIPAYIYDSVSVDEIDDVARVTGLPEIKRRSLIHALNMRAAAIKFSRQSGKPYSELTLIVAHLGGGITLSVHYKGRMIDIVSDDEGPFSPERAGRIPGILLGELCYSGKYDLKTMMKKFRGQGGLVAHLGTNKALEVEERINNGDQEAQLIYSAMAYQVAKSIGELATVVNGKVDQIILTGGIAYSGMITGWIREKVQFIAPVTVLAGENEMESLAWGALRVLAGEEKSYIYDID